MSNFNELFKDILNPKQLEGLRLLVTPFPQQQFNATEDRRSLQGRIRAWPASTVMPTATRTPPRTPSATSVPTSIGIASTPRRCGACNVQRLFGSQRALKTVEDFTEFEQRAAYFDGIPADAARKGTNVLERGSQVHFMAEFQELLDFPPAPKLNVFGKLDPAKASEARCAARSLFFGKGQCAACHTPPYYTDNLMHNLRVERFYKEIMINGRKASRRRPDQDLPACAASRTRRPYLHDDRLLTLEDTVEFFNLVLELKLNGQEKKDLVAFLRAL